MTKMTKQELFETMVSHVVAQGKPSRAFNEEFGDYSCRYRHESLKCAVGAIIPDDVYRKEFEGRSVEGLVEFLGEWKENPITEENLPFFGDVQRCCHDLDGAWTAVFLYRANVQFVADKHNLNTKFLDRLDFSEMTKFIQSRYSKGE